VVDELIHTHGLRTVIDLRSQRECDKDEGTCLLHTAHGAPSLKLLPMLDEQMLRDGLKRKLLRKPLLLLTLLPLMLLRLLPSRRLREYRRRARDRVLGRLLETTSLDEIYTLILRQRGAELKRLVETLTQPGALPALVHCTHGKVRHHCSMLAARCTLALALALALALTLALGLALTLALGLGLTLGLSRGQDRTGVAVAMCLHICGASLERIAADYAASHAWGCSVQGRAAMERLLPEHLKGLVNIEPLCAAHAHTMYALFSLVEQRHGSVDRYLDSIGVDAELRARCARALTEDAEA